MIRTAGLALSALLLVPAAAATAQERGCDIETGSSARIVPPGRGTGPVVSVGPQTPCAVIPNGWENAIGPIGVEVTPRGDVIDSPGEDGGPGRLPR